MFSQAGCQITELYSGFQSLRQAETCPTCSLLEVQPEQSPNSTSPVRDHGHATWEEHICSHELPRDHWQPKRQPPSSFPESYTANLRIDTTEDPRETKQACPPPQSSLFSSALRNIGLPNHRDGSVGVRSSSLARGKPGIGQLLFITSNDCR